MNLEAYSPALTTTACLLLALVLSMTNHSRLSAQVSTGDRAGLQEPQDQQPKRTGAAEDRPTPQSVANPPPLPFRSMELFNGKTLDGWQSTNFGGEGEVKVVDGNISVAAGYPMSGFNSTLTNLPTHDYEISLDALKTDGIDFFVGLTFPVNDSHCSFIVGGWAGSVVGLSCIDDRDAARNDTKKLMSFENNRWYKIKVRVRPERIQAWIDGQVVVDRNIKGCKISLRNETLASRPLGLSCFETPVLYRNIRLTFLTPE